MNTNPINLVKFSYFSPIVAN